MFVGTMSFNAQISDPAIGGTYMTLLNTMSNLGGTWSGTVALWLVDVLSFKDCEGVSDLSLDCDTMAELEVSSFYIIIWTFVIILKTWNLLEYPNIYCNHSIQ